ncbi:hypothetical protein LIER_19338 [Lithospermum erythrorhizon]|uniref:Uncharacterized protein n=1 Tax=Lithospermum erythrorhizon TaxID=34254 RepID=A0AAV3QIV7_LITER
MNRQERNYPKEKESLERAIPHEEVECNLFTGKDLGKTFQVGTNLDKQHRYQLIELIREFADVFAWGTENMAGVDPDLALHRLHERKTWQAWTLIWHSIASMLTPCSLQSNRGSDEKNSAIREEIANLLKSGVIRELQFPSWIVNVVLVKNPNNKWRMCTDFTNLNKPCPKDFYPLPCLGRLVDGGMGHEVFDFMNA